MPLFDPDDRFELPPVVKVELPSTPQPPDDLWEALLKSQEPKPVEIIPPLPAAPPELPPETDHPAEQSIEDRLRETIGAGETKVSFLRGERGDNNPWAGEHGEELDEFGWTAIIEEVGREETPDCPQTGWLYVDTADGMRHYVPEDRDIYIGPPIFSFAGVTTAGWEDTSPYEEKPEYPIEPIFQFVGGTAGTGKTFQAKQRAEGYDDAVLCATTGIAAVNLGGCTINSMLMYKDTGDLRVAYDTGRLGVFLRRLTSSKYFRIVLDEVSMLDGPQLDMLVLAIENLNEWLVEQGKRTLGLTLVGDFAQLPPVSGQFAFQRQCWDRFRPNSIMLTEPRRQADADFVRGLQAVRRGDRKEGLEYFAPKITNGMAMDFDGTTIFATNAEVDHHNALRMMNLPTPIETFTTLRVGKQSSEWVKNIPDKLEMKKGALVMVLANKREAGDFDDASRPMIYCNGDLAHYQEKISDKVARVILVRNGRDVLIPMRIQERNTPTGNTGERAVRNTKEGSVEYMPLRAAWATTCHKSQGLSLDRVQIVFYSNFWTTPGMLYVALSRARTPEGLKLVGSPMQFQNRIVVNPAVKEWL